MKSYRYTIVIPSTEFRGFISTIYPSQSSKFSRLLSTEFRGFVLVIHSPQKSKFSWLLSTEVLGLISIIYPSRNSKLFTMSTKPIFIPFHSLFLYTSIWSIVYIHSIFMTLMFICNIYLLYIFFFINLLIIEKIISPFFTFFF